MPHWTDKINQEAVTFFDSLSTPEIRRRQSLCAQQKRLAFEQGNSDAAADLERMSKALASAMLRRI